MIGDKFHILAPGQRKLPLEEIPLCGYDSFSDVTRQLLSSNKMFPLAYFDYDNSLILVLFDYSTGKFMISSAAIESETIPSMGIRQLYQFEKDIAERKGITFTGHPKLSLGDNCGKNLHEVNVGPIHAGIIEPGRFRFVCSGEMVHSLEIHLGYQYRGIEEMIVHADGNLKRMLLAEQITGDSVVANTIAMSTILENCQCEKLLTLERTLALEMERIAMHLSDIAALCGDCAYQLGQVSTEPLRTIVVNSLQLWCGSRSGRSLVRPSGTFYRLGLETIKVLEENFKNVKARLKDVTSNLLSSPSLLSRLDGKCQILQTDIHSFAARGLIAKASSVSADIRNSHYAVGYPDTFSPIILNKSGDLLSRLKARLLEAEQSIDVSLGLLKQIKSKWFEEEDEPCYTQQLDSCSFYLSPVEGFRGTILHTAMTDDTGKLINYRIFDPSSLAWPLLAHTMKGEQISDFPICNKSFNLSYLACDL